jgi:mannose-6-phosphate isomerase-like protein (cupin superfamily)
MSIGTAANNEEESDNMLHPKIFNYEKTAVVGDKKVRIPLAKTDLGLLEVQVFHEGGENKLHAHAHQDGFWFVKAGRVRFYTSDDVVVAELGANQGVVIPRGFKYWFESVPTDSEDDLELIHFAASDQKNLGQDHIFYSRSGVQD